VLGNLERRTDEIMKYKFEITKRLIGLNEYTNTNRYNKYAGAKQKKEEQDYIKYCILKQLGKIKIEKPVIGQFTWIEENKRRDLDNICFAKKFILDSLVELGILKDDNRKIVSGFIDKFEYSDKSKVIVELIEKE
jgi:Holliday junction resolvase RusA-like endonuclease